MRKFTLTKLTLTKLENLAALGPNVGVAGEVDTDTDADSVLIGVDGDVPGGRPRGT